MTDTTRSRTAPTTIALFLIVTLSALAVQAGIVSSHTPFSPGEVISAAAVNAVHDTHANEINDNHSRIILLEAGLASLMAEVASLKAENTSLKVRLTAEETKEAAVRVAFCKTGGAGVNLSSASFVSLPGAGRGGVFAINSSTSIVELTFSETFQISTFQGSPSNSIELSIEIDGNVLPEIIVVASSVDTSFKETKVLRWIVKGLAPGNHSFSLLARDLTGPGNGNSFINDQEIATTIKELSTN